MTFTRDFEGDALISCTGRFDFFPLTGLLLNKMSFLLLKPFCAMSQGGNMSFKMDSNPRKIRKPPVFFFNASIPRIRDSYALTARGGGVDIDGSHP